MLEAIKLFNRFERMSAKDIVPVTKNIISHPRPPQSKHQYVWMMSNSQEIVRLDIFKNFTLHRFNQPRYKVVLNAANRNEL